MRAHRRTLLVLLVATLGLGLAELDVHVNGPSDPLLKWRTALGAGR